MVETLALIAGGAVALAAAAWFFTVIAVAVWDEIRMAMDARTRHRGL